MTFKTTACWHEYNLNGSQATPTGQLQACTDEHRGTIGTGHTTENVKQDRKGSHWSCGGEGPCQWIEGDGQDLSRGGESCGHIDS